MGTAIMRTTRQCPWLSVIIPTYNGQTYITKTLESILSQGDGQIEVIAVDDGSTDDTVSILRSFSDRLHLAIIEREHAGNWVANSNFGLSLARGKYASFLHQDDIWVEGRLRVLRPLIRNNPLVTMLLHPSWLIDLRGNRVGLWRCPLPCESGGLDSGLVVERLLIQNFVSMPAPLFSREAALGIGGMDENLWYTADWDLWLKLAAAGKVLYTPEPLSAFRIHPFSQTVRRSIQSDDFRRQLEIVLERHLETHKSRIIGKRTVRRAAYFSLEVNIALATRINGQAGSLLGLLPQFFALGPSGWCVYLRDSRIIERVTSRIRAGMADRQTRTGLTREAPGSSGRQAGQ
jgi:glycosyltransferase involved in cell wall biosynthesis